MAVTESERSFARMQGSRSDVSSRPDDLKVRGRDASVKLLAGAVLSFISGIILLISFASPYWLVSWENTHNSFKKMGLWEFCFDGFRYPRYQLDHKFSGCHYVFSNEYQIIREWLLPSWLMTVQAFVSLALFPSFLAQVLIALVLMRFPLQIMKHEYRIMQLASFMEFITSPLLFLAVVVFGSMCFSRDWLMYPNFNYISWSYGFAVIAMFSHAAAGALLLLEAAEAKRRRAKSNNQLLMTVGHSSNGAGFI